MELFVAMDIINTRTVQYADYSLPACTVFERDDLQIARNYILLMEKAIEPLYESKSDVDILDRAGSEGSCWEITLNILPMTILKWPLTQAILR